MSRIANASFRIDLDLAEPAIRAHGRDKVKFEIEYAIEAVLERLGASHSMGDDPNLRVVDHDGTVFVVWSDLAAALGITAPTVYGRTLPRKKIPIIDQHGKIRDQYALTLDFALDYCTSRPAGLDVKIRLERIAGLRPEARALKA